MSLEKKVVFLVVLFLLFGFHPVQAQPEEAPVFSLGEIVVTGQKPGVKDISIFHEMDQEEVEATGSKTLAQALRFAPGIVVTYGDKNEPEISVHGYDSEKTLFLIDGIPYYETYYQKFGNI